MKNQWSVDYHGLPSKVNDKQLRLALPTTKKGPGLACVDFDMTTSGCAAPVF